MRREPPTRRRSPAATTHTILVYCGGARTEPDYFEGIRQVFRRASLTVKIKQRGVAPAQLARLAAETRDRRPGVYDEVWCVVDVDEFDVPAAVAEARRVEVNLAVSNPCFELWLLLHHADCTAHCDGYSDVAARLIKHVPAYAKTRLDFRAHQPGLADAVTRPKRLDPSGRRHDLNPSTNVWQLVERILQP